MWKGFCQRALKVLTMVSPVFLAACYGPQYYPRDTNWRPPADSVDEGSNLVVRKGRVIDAATKMAIVGVRVGCITQAPDKPFAITDAEGRFSLPLPDGDLCTGYAFDDVDAGLNGGKYVSQILPWCECEEMVVEMQLLVK